MEALRVAKEASAPRVAEEASAPQMEEALEEASVQVRQARQEEEASVQQVMEAKAEEPEPLQSPRPRAALRSLVP